MDKQIIREIEFENEGLVSDLEKKAEIETRYKEKKVTWERFEREIKVLANRDKKIQDKMNPIIQKLVAGVEKDTFEAFSRVYTRDGKVIVEVVNMVEQLKKEMEEAK